MDTSESQQLGGDNAAEGEQILPTRERFIWLAATIGLASILTFSTLFQLERLAVASNAVDQGTQQLESLQNELVEISQISEDIESYRAQLEICSIAVAQVADEIEELEGDLSTISLFTQSMWHSGWRGIDRAAAIASVENFGVLAQTKSIDEGESSCVL